MEPGERSDLLPRPWSACASGCAEGVAPPVMRITVVGWQTATEDVDGSADAVPAGWACE